MQAVQQCPKLGECGRRGQRRSNSEVRALRWIGDPRRESADAAIGQLAENVLTFWEFHPPLNTKALTVERVKRVMDLDALGDMGIMFLARAKPGKLIWGVGPAFLLPTATDSSLGTGKFSLGPTVVALVQPGKWTLGGLVSNLNSVAGPSGRADVNSMTLQYFVNYNLKKGYFLTLQPIITANWNAPDGNVWLVPFGGGIGRIMKFGSQPVNVGVQAYWNAIRPDSLPSPTWQLKLSIAFLYPKAPG
jgi:hypothetical protein